MDVHFHAGRDIELGATSWIVQADSRDLLASTIQELTRNLTVHFQLLVRGLHRQQRLHPQLSSTQSVQQQSPIQ